MSSILPTIAFNKDAFPNRRHVLPAGPNHSACQNGLTIEHNGFA